MKLVKYFVCCLVDSTGAFVCLGRLVFETVMLVLVLKDQNAVLVLFLVLAA